MLLEVAIQEATRKVREGVIDVFEKCEDSKMTEASATGGADKPTQENEEVAVIMSAVHVKEVEGTGASM